VECASAVDAHGFSAVSQTSVERASAVVARHVPVATHYIVDVLAVFPCSGSSGVADTETEFAFGHEGGPLVNLLHIAKRI